jgi:hypothetical protein
MYHPFCLGEMLKNNNKCMVCGEVFHPNWWTNFGFREQDKELEALAITICLDEQREELKNALTSKVGLSLMFGEFHGLSNAVFKDFMQIVGLFFMLVSLG